MNWITNNWLKLIVVILLALLALAVVYYFVRIVPEQRELASKVQNLELQNQTKLADTTVALEQTQTELTQEKVKTAELSENNNDTALINFKLDVQTGEDLREALLNASYNTPHQLCPNIIASRTARNNIYFGVIDAIDKLDTDYGMYRSTVPYINTWLTNLRKTPQIVKDKCESLGYYL